MKKRLFMLILIILVMAMPAFASTASSQAIDYQGDVFDRIYGLFQKQLNMSFKSVRDNILPSLLMGLITLEIMWLGIRAVMQRTMQLSEFLTKGFIVIVTIIVTQNLDLFAKALMQIFTKTAAVAGDSGNLYSDTITVGKYAMFKPSVIIGSCKPMMEPLALAREQLKAYAATIRPSGLNITGYLSLVFPAWAAMAACWIVELILLVMVSFVNINITMWMIEFSFLLTVCAICLPWQIFAPTKFIASGVWQALFGQAIKMFCIVLLVAIAPSLFRQVTASTVGTLLTSMTTQDGFAYSSLMGLIVTTIGLTLTYCYFLMKGPAIAKAIIVGQPTMETLGSHAVTRMGAQAIGAARGLGGLAASGIGHGIGALIGGGKLGKEIIDILRTPRGTDGSKIPVNKSKLSKD